MRAGWVVSFIGHVGAALMTMLAWEARTTLAPSSGAVVPVEIVDVAAESNVRALAEEVPEEEIAADAETPPAEEETAPIPAPTPQQRPRQRTAEQELAEMLAGLPDRSREPTRRRNEGQPAERNQAGAGLGTEERASLEDRLRAIARAHISRNQCWRMPLDLPEPDRLIVTVRFRVNRNGTLSGEPEVISPRNYTFDPYMARAAAEAMRAIRRCDPFPFADDPVAGEYYDLWREMEYTFRPRL